MKRPDISIIIVNYKSASLINDCIRSIKSETPTISYEIIVVDNNSKDNSKELIETNFPEVRWLQMDYNAGFARANNAGIKYSKAETVLLLNPDTIIINKAIEKSFIELSTSHFVACGVQLLNEDRTFQISGNYFVKGSLNNLLPLPVIGKIIRNVGLYLGIQKPHVDKGGKVVVVDWINGAYLMVKKEIVNIVGLMDEDFFLYAEEAEWCSRLRKKGEMVIFGDINVFHLQGEISNEAYNSSGKGYYNLYDKKGLQIMLSNFVRIRKQYGIGWYMFHMLFYSFTVPLFFIYVLFKMIFFSKNTNVQLRLFKGYVNNVLRLWSFLPKIIINRPFFYKVL